MSKTAPKELLNELSGISTQAQMLANTVSRFTDLIKNISCSVASMMGTIEREPLARVGKSPALSSLFQDLISLDKRIEKFILNEEKEMKNVLNLSKNTLKSVKEICEQ